MLQASKIPMQPLRHLDALWIQVAGTLCNLACTHCFVSAGPGQDRHGLMSPDELARHVADAAALGVREFYFTGGEPFLHPELLPMLEDTLRVGPCTVLTNGTLFGRARLESLAALREVSRYALEIRVSLDGATAASHDALRGAGTFERTLDGLRGLVAHGFLPIVAVTHGADEDPGRVVETMARVLREAGIPRPRIKLLPLLALGRRAWRSGSAFGATDTLAGFDLSLDELDRLQCGSCRAVSTQGVFVCPLLVDEPNGRMGGRLTDTLGAYPLAHSACLSCHLTGLTCANS